VWCRFLSFRFPAQVAGRSVLRSAVLPHSEQAVVTSDRVTFSPSALVLTFIAHRVRYSLSSPTFHRSSMFTLSRFAQRKKIESVVFSPGLRPRHPDSCVHTVLRIPLHHQTKPPIVKTTMNRVSSVTCSIWYLVCITWNTKRSTVWML